MAIELNHTIVAARDAETSARWFAEMFGTDEPTRLYHFWQVTTANGVGLDFASVPAGRDIDGIHYAFLVSEDDFDAIYGRIRERGMEHWPGPVMADEGTINHDDGGRGVYFLSNDGHFLEILTVPYGGWPS
jgi:hypothetical protein